MNILQRYILRELLAPVLLSILFFTFVLLLGQLFQMAELLLEARVGWAIFLEVIGTVALSLVILTVPMAALLGCLMGFGRLTSENEMLAIRVGGVRLFRVIWPVYLIALAGSVGLMMSGWDLLPAMIKRLTDKQTEIQFRILTNLQPGRNYENLAPRGSEISLYFEERLPALPGDGEYTLRMKRIAMRVVGEADELAGTQAREGRATTTSDGSRVEELPQETIFFASEGTIVGDLESRQVTITLQDGTIMPLNRLIQDAESKQVLCRESPEKQFLIQFESMVQTLSPKRDSERLDRMDPRQLTLTQILSLTQNIPDVPMMEDSSSRKPRVSTPWRVYLNARNELFQRMTMPWSLLAFVLIAVPLAVQLRPNAKTVSFLIAIGLIGLYYLMISWAGAVGMTNSRYTLLAFLAPNVVIGGTGIFLFWRSQR